MTRVITPSEIESVSDFSPFDVPVDTGTQNFLKCILSACLHSYIHSYIGSWCCRKHFLNVMQLPITNINAIS